MAALLLLALGGFEAARADEGTAGVTDVLVLAEDMRRSGAPGNCHELLMSIDGMVGDGQLSDYLYLRGFCAELAWDSAGAAPDYEEVITRGRGHVDEARFRLALVLEDLGDGHGALQQMAILHKNEGWDLNDQVGVNLERALAQIAAGRVKRGVQNLEAALVVAESWNKQSWLRAKAHYVLLDQELAAAERASALKGGDRGQGQAVTARVQALAAAQEAMLPLVAIQEPEWILHGLYRLGSAYVAFGDELVAARVPARLSDAEAAIYRAEVAKQRESLRDKAAHVYDQGIQLSLRLQFESPLLARIVLERDRINASRQANGGG